MIYFSNIYLLILIDFLYYYYSFLSKLPNDFHIFRNIKDVLLKNLITSIGIKKSTISKLIQSCKFLIIKNRNYFAKFKLLLLSVNLTITSFAN